MEKKITVKEFIEQYNESGYDIEVIKEIITTNYVPFNVKLRISQRIVENNSLQNGDVKANTGVMYLSFTASVLRLYTNLDISSEETDKDYDMLQQYGLVDDILNSINQRDLAEYRRIFSMCEEDFRTNYLSTPNFVQRQINKICDVLGKFIKVFQKKLDEVDEDKIANKLEQTIKKYYTM